MVVTTALTLALWADGAGATGVALVGLGNMTVNGLPGLEHAVTVAAPLGPVVEGGGKEPTGPARLDLNGVRSLAARATGEVADCLGGGGRGHVCIMPTP